MVTFCVNNHGRRVLNPTVLLKQNMHTKLRSNILIRFFHRAIGYALAQMDH